MLYFKLKTLDGRIFYYDSDELETARQDKAIFGGTLTDRHGKVY